MEKKISKEAALKFADELIALEKKISCNHRLTSIEKSLQWIKPIQRGHLNHSLSDFSHSTGTSSYSERDNPGSALYWANRHILS